MQPQNQAEEERQLRAAIAASQGQANAGPPPLQGFDVRNVTQARHANQGGSGVGGWQGPDLQQLVADPRCLGTGGIVGCGAILVIILLSMAVVHPTEYGLRFNRWSLEVERGYREPGRHFIGPLSHMMIYPSVVQTIEFSTRSTATGIPMRTRTDEGLDLQVHLAFQYKLKPDALYDLYRLYRDDYKIVFERKSTSVLLAVASRYEAEKYWTEREEIAADMLQGLRNELVLQAEVTGIEIFIIQLPNTFEAKIVETQVQRQIRSTRQSEQEAAVTRAKIQVMLADFRREQQIIVNAATANATLLTRTAEANAQKRRIDVESTAMAGVKEKIGLSADGLVGYQRGIAYQTLENATFMFGVPQAAAIVSVPQGGAAAQAAGGVGAEFQDQACGAASVMQPQDLKDVFGKAIAA